MITIAISVQVEHLSIRAKKTLEGAGCKFIPIADRAIIVVYPQGTTRDQMYMFTYGSKYRIKLPCGTRLREEERVGSDLRDLYLYTDASVEKDHGRQREYEVHQEVNL